MVHVNLNVLSKLSEGDDIYVIDPDLCIDCGACADVCPVDAPQPEEEPGLA